MGRCDHCAPTEPSVAKVQMSSFSYISYYLLFGMAWCLALADLGKEAKASSMEVLGHSEWKDVTVAVHSTTEPKVFQVPARKSWFRCKLPYLGGASVPVTAFVTKNGNAWIGPEGAGTNFYIETEKGVLRGYYDGSGRLLWCESLVTMPSDSGISIDKVIAQFERKPDGDALFNAGILCRQETEKIRYTFFAEALDWGHRLRIANQPAGLVLGAGIVRAQVTGGMLRLELENKGHGLDYAASVWIDINSKKVVKAMEKGQQVYPK